MEVRAVGVTKVSLLVMILIFNFKKAFANLCSISIQGAAIDRILGEIVHHSHVKAPIDYVLCVGHFLPKVRQLYLYIMIVIAFLIGRGLGKNRAFCRN